MTLLGSQVEWPQKDDKENKKCPPHKKIRKGQEKSKLNPPRYKYLDALLASSGVHFEELLRMTTLMMIPTLGVFMMKISALCGPFGSKGNFTDRLHSYESCSLGVIRERGEDMNKGDLMVDSEGKMQGMGEEVDLEPEVDEVGLQDGKPCDGELEATCNDCEEEDTWPQDGEYQVLNYIEKRARFMVGNYRDKVCCDVISMQACHLLLGRPWKYDKSTKNDGRLNTYSLVHGGKKFTLHPLSPFQVNELHQKLRELKEKGSKRQEPEKRQKGEVSGYTSSNVGVFDYKAQKGQGPMVMLARRKDLFKDQDMDAPMLLLLYALNTNFSSSYSSFSFYFPPSISLVLQEFDDVFPQ
ncbi:hypothetical protein CQW23_25982 [Capsicum baccatum]|uniref:Uncharacterized protein n=1 Tax=Capsicum baccatum TaxID=33114 RepID=A0A2G2VMJ3_CAPBA|nr:hypothetical protein CQW23_25982 [Capsicum baccatum]